MSHCDVFTFRLEEYITMGSKAKVFVQVFDVQLRVDHNFLTWQVLLDAV